MISIVKERQEELRALCAKFHVKRFEIFGSAATGQFDPVKSDLDFLVEFEEMTPADHANSYFSLLEALQDLFARNIDLVEVRAIKNPYFKKDVDSTRVLVYGT